jgi:hypothetical protein
VSARSDDLSLAELSRDALFVQVVRLVASEAISPLDAIGTRFGGLEHAMRSANGSDGESHQSAVNELPIPNAPEHSSVILPAYESWPTDQSDRSPRRNGVQAMLVVRQQMSNF